MPQMDDDDAIQLARDLRLQEFGAGRTDASRAPSWSRSGRAAGHRRRPGDAAVLLLDGDEVLGHEELTRALTAAVAATASGVILDAYITKMISGEDTGLRPGIMPMPSVSKLLTKALVGGRVLDRAQQAEDDEAERARRSSSRTSEPVNLVAVDLLWLDGEWLLDVPLLERKRLLASVLPGDPTGARRACSSVRPIETWIGSWREHGLPGARVQGRELALPTGRGRPGLDHDTDAPPLRRRPDARLQGVAAVRGGTVGSMPETALTPAMREQIARLGEADIMVGIPSFKNAATIGYVVRAAQAGLVQYFPDLRPVVVNSDAGSPGRHRPRRHRYRAARLHRADPARPPEPQALAGQPDLPRDRRGRRQGRGAAHDLRDRRRAQGPGARRRRLRPAQHRARMDRAPVRADPQGRLRLRGAALRALQVRRHDHEHRHLPADPGPVRPSDPPADRWRLRGQRRSRPALPDARRLDRRRQQVRHRHLDDDLGAGRRVRGLPDAPRRQDPRPQGPGLGPRADVPPGRRHDPAAGREARRATGSTSRAATTSPPTASSGSSTRRRSR